MNLKYASGTDETVESLYAEIKNPNILLLGMPGLPPEARTEMAMNVT